MQLYTQDSAGQWIPSSGEDHSVQFSSFLFILLAASIIALGLRFWSNRVSQNHRFGYDDFFAGLTLPFMIAQFAIEYTFMRKYPGRSRTTFPVFEFDPDDLAAKEELIRYHEQNMALSFSALSLFYVAIYLPKLSALFFYHRIFNKTSRRFTWSLWILGFVNTAWLIVALITTSAGCLYQYHMDESLFARGICIQPHAWIVVTISSTVIDVLILVMPLPRIWRLQTTRKQKCLLAGAFIAGYSVVAISIGRAVLLFKKQPNPSSNADMEQWLLFPLSMWLMAEPSVSLISICLPRIFYLFRRVHRQGMGGFLKGDHEQLRPQYTPPTPEPSLHNLQSEPFRIFVRQEVRVSTHASDSLDPETGSLRPFREDTDSDTPWVSMQHESHETTIEGPPPVALGPVPHIPPALNHLAMR